MKLNNSIEQFKKEINKFNIEKSRKNELKELEDELGYIEIIDVNKIWKITKKFFNDVLKLNREIEHNYTGIKKKIVNDQENVKNPKIKERKK